LANDFVASFCAPKIGGDSAQLRATEFFDNPVNGPADVLVRAAVDDDVGTFARKTGCDGEANASG
jgi:predicted alpha-1,6-mannanase (GH76 family)